MTIDESVAHENIDESEHESDVGARQRLEEPIRRVRRHRAQRIDTYNRGPVGLRLLDKRPQVTIGEAGIRTPQHNALRMTDFHRIGGPARAVGGRSPNSRRLTAHRINHAGSTDALHEPFVCMHRQNTLVPGVPQTHDGLAAVGGGDGLPAA